VFLEFITKSVELEWYEDLHRERLSTYPVNGYVMFFILRSKNKKLATGAKF
jgi:hypothetical protein